MLANFQTRTHIVVLIPYIRSLDVFILQNSAILDPWTDSTAPLLTMTSTLLSMYSFS